MEGTHGRKMSRHNLFSNADIEHPCSFKDCGGCRLEGCRSRNHSSSVAAVEDHPSYEDIYRSVGDYRQLRSWLVAAENGEQCFTR